MRVFFVRQVQERRQVNLPVLWCEVEDIGEKLRLSVVLMFPSHHPHVKVLNGGGDITYATQGKQLPQGHLTHPQGMQPIPVHLDSDRRPDIQNVCLYITVHPEWSPAFI